MNFTELRKIWEEADKKAKDWRTTGEKELLARMFDAYSGLKECGWSDIDYCPKDGTRASFLIKFTDSKNARTLKISSGNRAQFKRDDDAEVIEQWMTNRGFIVMDSEDDGE